jgi:predicted PurR-regulated permease PerM
LIVKQHVKTAAAVMSLIVLLLAIWFAREVLLLAFAGILFAIILRTVTDWLARLLHLRTGIALALTCILSLTAVGLFFWFIAPQLSDEADAVSQSIQSAWHHILAWLHRRRWAGALGDSIQPGASGFVLRALSGVGAAAGGVVIVLFLALFFALDPGLYKRGLVKLAPKAAEARSEQVLCECGEQLQKWLLSKLLLMAFVGVATASGLWAMGMPLILALAILAAALDFIPNFGPLVAAIPAALIAFSRSPMLALEVIVL